MGYDFSAIESKWQQYWETHGTFRQPNPGQAGFEPKPKCYVLDMFPYPSGAGLHVGHPEGYTATDIVARWRRMNGFNVLHPMGYDAFGLPAEQYAVEHGVHPRESTDRNVANIERQIKMFGFSYDWSRRVATTDPEYYRWTQWIFLQLYNSWFDPEARAARPISELIDRLEAGKLMVDLGGNLVPRPMGMDASAVLGVQGAVRFFSELEPDQQRRLIDEYRLAYQAEAPVNWCPRLGTVLANEEVTNEGRSERGNYPVYRRPLRQWMLRITAYAERLLEGLDQVDWPDPIKLMQRNWIGKSVGAEVDFPLQSVATEQWFTHRQANGFPAIEDNRVIRVFTTRPDTLFGATYMVLAPEHPLVARITTDEQRAAVEAYVKQAARKSELERTAQTKEKTGVFTGAHAINPANRQPVPIWVADYVMMGYGTGAIMAVPAHDTRDLEFAEQFGLPVVQVVQPPSGQDWRGFVDDGVAVNSGPYDGLPTPEFKQKITADLAAAGLARPRVNYKLRDWLFSRQRYWGEPFPIIHCDACGTLALGEEQLPLLLPEISDFTPATSEDPNALPEPPLARAADWVRAVCPRCGGGARREANTMPQWAGSCWYYLRYLDPKNDGRLVGVEAERYWMDDTGVDLYVGGAEHAVLHLLYSRFWHKVLYDRGCVSSPEPFGRLFNQGMITSFTYRDRRGVSIAYDKVDLAGEKPVHKETGEVLAVSIEKMSKALKNVINPDDVIRQHGADTFRLYEMFMGPLEASKPWNTRDIPGVHRFCQRVWRMILGDEERAGMVGAGVAGVSPASSTGVPAVSITGVPPVSGGGTGFPARAAQPGKAVPPAPVPQDEVERALHRLIKKVGEDIEAMKFNTAIAAMMEFVNTVYAEGRITVSQAERFVLVLAPFAPHLAEEIWQRLGHGQSLAHEPWPTFDPARLVEATVEIPVQVNGKLRGRVTVPADADADAIVAAALADARIAELTAGKTIVKKIVVPGKLVNLVVK